MDIAFPTHPNRRRRRGRKRGAALVELALILPLYSFILVASTDFARVFHDLVIVTDCARNGSLYASQNPSLSGPAYQSGITAAGLADAQGLGETPTISSATGSLGVGNSYVDVTVSSTFKMIADYPGLPGQLTLRRTIRMRLQPTIYRML